MPELGALLDQLRTLVAQEPTPQAKAALLNRIRQALHEASPCQEAPVDFVRLVPIEQVEPNDYNPNVVAHIEMGLLLRSIEHDGYTQPCVTVYDPDKCKWIIVDGFHRYFVMKSNAPLRERYHGLLPITVLNKGLTDRMASTVRHNRARGRHAISGMSSLVFKMLDQGISDADVCMELGMEPEELIRLKHITGFAKLFENQEYQKAWVTRKQVEIERRYREKHPEAAPPT